jgi:hypothetical protein
MFTEQGTKRILYVIEFDCDNPMKCGGDWHRKVGAYAESPVDAMGQAIALHAALRPRNVTARVMTPDDLKHEEVK